MSKREISYGKCFFCEQPFAKNGIARHLKACQARKIAIAAEKGKPFRTLHLQVQGLYTLNYWLHFEIAAKATLADLDNYLRDIWLECCGHLSMFTINHVIYTANPEFPSDFGFGLWGREEKSLQTPLWKAIRSSDAFTYEYDFGTTTYLTLKIMDEREGVPPQNHIRLLARNYAPDFRCAECEQPATEINTYDEYQSLCKACALDHEEYEYFLPIVNSPRTGDCGYTGPNHKNYIFDEIHTPGNKK